MNNVIPFNKPAPEDEACSFCKRKKSQLGKVALVSNAAGTKHICGDCVAKCEQRLVETETESQGE